MLMMAWLRVIPGLILLAPSRLTSGLPLLTEPLLLLSVAAVSGVCPLPPLRDHWVPGPRLHRMSDPGVRGGADLLTSDPPGAPGQPRAGLGPKRGEECALNLVPSALLVFVPVPTLMMLVSDGQTVIDTQLPSPCCLLCLLELVPLLLDFSLLAL